MDHILSKAVSDVLSERQRQIASEGYTAAHDDAHNQGELARAAACYALAADTKIYDLDKGRPSWAESYIPPVARYWPWNWQCWKPSTKRRDLIKAASLLIAEIERLDRENGAS